MCGRYIAPEERAAAEILAGIWAGRLDRQFAAGEMAAEGSFEAYPSCFAPVFVLQKGAPAVKSLRWGFQSPVSPTGKPDARGVFNARSESALLKPLFRDSLLSRRCVVPTLGYYEWNREKTRFRFLREGAQVLLLAGIYQPARDSARFCVLTTEAADNIRSIHSRMPVILQAEEVPGWFSGENAMALLHRSLPLTAAAE